MSNPFPKPFSRLDFTSNKYEELCRAVVNSKYTPITLADYLEKGHQDGKAYLIMRHDVDRAPKRALGVAKIEHEFGVPATYYFRAQRGTYVPDILDRIASLGHEIGYHYETIDKCKGNRETAMVLFKQELASFRTRYEVRTVCAHGNPLTTNDNKDIWKGTELSDFGLLGEAFLALDFRRFAYFSDSGRTWLNSESQKMPGKDSVQTAFGQFKAKTSDDVIRVVKEGSIPNICILTHPERWSSDMVGFTGRYFLDMAFSWAKVAITVYRRSGKQ